MSYYRINKHSISLHLRVKPNARKTQVCGVVDEHLVVAVQALPVEGAANKALIAWLAKELHLKQKEITITRGAQIRYKVIELPMTEEVMAWIKRQNECE